MIYIVTWPKELFHKICSSTSECIEEDDEQSETVDKDNDADPEDAESSHGQIADLEERLRLLRAKLTSFQK